TEADREPRCSCWVDWPGAPGVSEADGVGPGRGAGWSRGSPGTQRLHKLGLLPSVFQPNEATQTLRAYLRQRANHVRLSGQHIQRMQKALELRNLKLTKVLGDVTGVTGLKIIRAIVKGERDPQGLDSHSTSASSRPRSERTTTRMPRSYWAPASASY